MRNCDSKLKTVGQRHACTRKGAFADKLSVSFVLPMFNEQDNIENTIKAVRSLAKELTDDYEIVVSDDASQDMSADIVEELAKKDKDIKLVRLNRNTKFGGAFAKGFKAASKDVIVYMDSDMPVKLEDVKASFPLIREFDIVTGYSKVKKGDTLKRKIISSVYNFMVQTVFGLSIKDINSGYKIVRKSLVDDIKFISHSPFVDVELFLQAKRKKCKVYQFPLIFISRSGGKSYIAGMPTIIATFIDMFKVKLFSLCHSERGRSPSRRIQIT
ncbi:MAG: glycosyltransferase family 2 protein [Candidatus Omnitrophota bacterium]